MYRKGSLRVERRALLDGGFVRTGGSPVAAVAHPSRKFVWGPEGKRRLTYLLHGAEYFLRS